MHAFTPMHLCVMQGINPTLVAYLDIHVRRSHILQDSLQQIVSRPQVGVIGVV